MRRWKTCAPMIALCLLLTACGGKAAVTEDGAQRLQAACDAASGCSGAARITADYGRRVYEYELEFALTGTALELTVTAPEEAAGLVIRGEQGQTQLEYDGLVLETGQLSPDGLSPVSALPALLSCMAGGFSDQWGEEEEQGAALLRVDYRQADGQPGAGTEATLWARAEDCTLVQGELTVDGYRVILCQFERFAWAGGDPQE